MTLKGHWSEYRGYFNPEKINLIQYYHVTVGNISLLGTPSIPDAVPTPRTFPKWSAWGFWGLFWFCLGFLFCFGLEFFCCWLGFLGAGGNVLFQFFFILSCLYSSRKLIFTWRMQKLRQITNTLCQHVRLTKKVLVLSGFHTTYSCNIALYY